MIVSSESLIFLTFNKRELPFLVVFESSFALTAPFNTETIFSQMQVPFHFVPTTFVLLTYRASNFLEQYF